MCDPLPDPLFVCHTPFNIGNGNIVSRPSTITPPTGISRGVFRVTILVPLAQLTHDQRTPAVSFEQVVGAAVPAAVCRWGLCPCCPGVGRCLSGVNNHSQQAAGMFRRTKGLYNLLLSINYCYAVVYIIPWAHYHPPPRGISNRVFMVTISVPLAQLTNDQRTLAVSFEQVVGAAVPAAVCLWGLCPCCPGVGRSLGGKQSL